MKGQLHKGVMNMRKSYTYYGRKNEKYYVKSYKIYPANMQHSLIECCMGSGNQTANSLYGENVKRIAIEKDKSIYKLNKSIQCNPYKTVELLGKIVYSKEEYARAIQVVKDINNGKDISDDEVVKATYGSLIMSYNSMRSGYREVDEKRKKKIFLSIPGLVFGLNKAWRGVEIINGDFMDYPQYWTAGRDTFVFADVPYEKKKRGTSDKCKNAGYICDWNGEDQKRFIEFVIEAQKSETPSNVMICANIPLDEEGNLRDMESDYYNSRLLKAGFRLVVVEKRNASVANSKGKRRPVAEVVYINYKNILGKWSEIEYYDYEDIYGSEV